jgi:hypothetical protein
MPLKRPSHGLHNLRRAARLLLIFNAIIVGISRSVAAKNIVGTQYHHQHAEEGISVPRLHDTESGHQTSSVEGCVRDSNPILSFK